jgi:hypothetical protein
MAIVFFAAGAYITKRLQEVHATALQVDQLGKGDVRRLLRSSGG